MDYTEDNEFINKQYLMMELAGEYYTDDDIEETEEELEDDKTK